MDDLVCVVRPNKIYLVYGILIEIIGWLLALSCIFNFQAIVLVFGLLIIIFAIFIIVNFFTWKIFLYEDHFAYKNLFKKLVEYHYADTVIKTVYRYDVIYKVYEKKGKLKYKPVTSVGLFSKNAKRLRDIFVRYGRVK